VLSLIKNVFAEHISPVSKSCFQNNRDLRRIRKTIDQTIACTTATPLIHSKIDYCNSLLLDLAATQTNRLQLVLNSAARAVTKKTKISIEVDRLNMTNGRLRGLDEMKTQAHNLNVFTVSI